MAKSFIDEQKDEAQELGIFYEESWDDELFERIEHLSPMETFNFIFLLASCQSGIWFDADGYPEDGSIYYFEVFFLLCKRFDLIHERTQIDINRFYLNDRDVLVDQLIDYWNYGSQQSPVCCGKESLRKFFFKCIIKGEWDFSMIEKKYKIESN